MIVLVIAVLYAIDDVFFPLFQYTNLDVAKGSPVNNAHSVFRKFMDIHFFKKRLSFIIEVTKDRW